MKLKKLKLNNIRSYTEQEITFPEGSLLLSGNIGSGKSSILLGIDFALFGLQRGNLDGNAILRNGEDKGSVELCFEINNKNIILQRNLKRSGSGVVQEPGQIIIDNETHKATPIELKDKVLELLNYPKQLLTKNKSLIYRYTVYTPQEQMKQILLGKKEDRLETLRKVFGIDKYKRIKDNSKIVISKIKEKKKFYQGETSNLEIKETELKEKIIEFEQVEKEINQLLPLLTIKQQELEERNKESKQFEASLEQLNKLKADLTLLKNNLKHLTTKKQEDQTVLEKINKKLSELQQENLEVKDSYQDLIQTNKEQIELLEKEIRLLLDKKQESKVHKANSLTLQSKITDINQCPTCYQQVSDLHKTNIHQQQQNTIQQMDKQLLEIQTKEQELQNKIQTLKQNLESLTKREAEIKLIQHKLKEFQENKTKAQELQTKQEQLEKAINEIHTNKTQIQEQINNLKDTENNFSQIKQRKEELEKEYRSLEIKKASLEAKKIPLERNLQALEKEIQQKNETIQKLNKINKTQFFLESSFNPTLDSIEKNVMFKVHEEFNSIFTSWLAILVDLNINLDEEFTPKIEQNGYDIDYEFLSGGEKTATALAYRLALNQVINKMMVEINTKGLLILDEPTDGFSSEQLDRVKDLINELDMEQIILVSHESKVESFVDNILRFEKQDHITQLQ